MKKILFLGERKSKIINYLKKKTNLKYFKVIDENLIKKNQYDLIICFRYKKIFSKKFVNLYKNKIINCHLSFLPWNRGSIPNFWSFFYDTPKGVTLHFIDKNIDTGKIIDQRIVNFKLTKRSTLKSTYNKLEKSLVDLLYINLENIIYGKIKFFAQDTSGTYYGLKDFKNYKKILKKGWNTRILKIENRGYEFF